MKSESETKLEIRNWIVKKNGKITESDIQNETPILENRIISSLQVMDLILHLERLSGSKVRLEQLKPGVFKSVDTIYQGFFEKEA